MDYNSRGDQHLTYAHTTLSSQLGQLSLSRAEQQMGPREAASHEGSRTGGVYEGSHPYTGYLPPTHQQDSARHARQQRMFHQHSQDLLTTSSLTLDTHALSTSPSPRQLPSPIPQEFTPKSFSSLGAPSARSTSHALSLSSSPMRSSLGTTHPASLSPRPDLGINCVGVSNQSLRQARLDSVQLASSLPTQLTSTLSSQLTSSIPSPLPSSLPPQQLASTLPSQLTPPMSSQLSSSLSPQQLGPSQPPQQQALAGPYTTQMPQQSGGLVDPGVGLSWHPAATGSPMQGYSQLHAGSTQHPPNNLTMLGVNQYSNQSLMNGQINHSLHLQQTFQSHHVPSQVQYSNMDYSGMQQQQQQQQQYHQGFDQLQSVTQNSGNYQFNIDYVDNSYPQGMYQDYYYGDYQYSDNYCSLGEGFLDPNQLNSMAMRSTTPYGDETVEDLGPEEVRWFYKVEADKKWTPFIGYDSLRIEWKYRDLLQDVRSEEGGSPVGKPKWSGNLSPKDKQDGAQQDVDRIVVRGGLYEVDVKQRKCESIYWQGEVYIITRGTWFYDTWGPVEDNVADRIELEHLTHFRGHLLSSQRLDDTTKEAVHSLSLPEGDVEWFSASEVYLTSDATPSRLMRSVGKKLGFQRTGYKLHRGYSIDATSSDKPPDINHIVFVIHGIGQKMERGRIIKNCTGLRESVNYLKQKYFPGMSKSSSTVEFFPVEWRSSLVLDAGVIDSITPQKILNIRQMLNASFMDIMYYNSPLYRDEIISGLTNEMNRLYTMFTQRNPYFEANRGKVSMVAHSLGCVITYDIVTGWNPANQFDQQLVQSLIKNLEEEKKYKRDYSTSLREELQVLLSKHKCSHSQPSLNFKIENFFCLGSPLAVFLGLRTKPSGETTDIIPQKLCKRLLNIFHPADPVAYRIEPLLCPEYSNISPVLIHSYNAAEKLPYSEMPLEPIGIAGRDKEKEGKEAGDKSRADSECNTPVSSVPSTPVKGGASSWSLWGLMKGSKRSSDSGSTIPEVASVLQEGRSLMERMDFVLREGSMENSYISAITSHTSYWTNYDVSHFILSVLYPDLQPPTSASKLEIIRP
ncbi:phospholipase DDHD1-like isoform X2 [Portunus trituberculatus]|uniref:phospholipase DDHD1-like isoform X2 n=1 Tax=Portunus trituberculatus TaxID=210409 RepID=UPI001E1D099C|nr:phospholipase DDHD1-like isoform X2 [Portunus trituberculatus]